jgi:hypothetical protein
VLFVIDSPENYINYVFSLFYVFKTKSGKFRICFKAESVIKAACCYRLVFKAACFYCFYIISLLV